MEEDSRRKSVNDPVEDEGISYSPGIGCFHDDYDPYDPFFLPDDSNAVHISNVIEEADQTSSIRSLPLMREGSVVQSPIESLSLMQRRLRNMERNHAYLQELGLLDLPRISKVSKHHDKDDPLDSMKKIRQDPDVYIKMDETARQQQFDQLNDNFPHREEVIKRLFSYIHQDFSPAPAILIHGPSGVGKSSICREVLDRLAAGTWAEVSCQFYSSPRLLIRAIWTALAAIGVEDDGVNGDVRRSRNNNEQRFPKDHERRQYDGIEGSKTAALAISSRAPNSFGDLATNLKPLLKYKKELKRTNCVSRRETVVAYLLLKDIDSAERLEKGLRQRLLQLTELSGAALKVIAITSAVPAKEVPCIALGFSPYSLDQIRDILIAKAKVLRAASDDALLLQVLDFALPLLLTRWRHIGELWERVHVVWSKSQAVERTSVVTHDENPATRTATLRRLIQSTVQQLMHMPAPHLRSSTEAQHPLTVGTMKSRSQSHVTAAASDTVGTRAGLQELAAFMQPDTLLPRDWHVHLPLARKYLLVASFMASRIPKEADDFVFAGSRRSRRKAARRGADVDEDLDTAPTSSRGGGVGAGGAAGGPRSFTLDRLTSIFAQLASSGDVAKLGGGARAALAFGYDRALHDGGKFTAEQIASSYGDADLFASIHSLVQRRLLFTASGSSLDRPVYISAVTEKMARELSTSLGINLQDYVSRLNQ